MVKVGAPPEQVPTLAEATSGTNFLTTPAIFRVSLQPVDSYIVGLLLRNRLTVVVTLAVGRWLLSGSMLVILFQLPSEADADADCVQIVSWQKESQTPQWLDPKETPDADARQ